MKLSDVLIILGVALLAFAAVRAVIAQKKKGGCAGCSGCPIAADCHKEEKTHE